MAWWIGILISMALLHTVDNGHLLDYLENHLLLTFVLPLVTVFLAAFAWRAHLLRQQRQNGPRAGGEQAPSLERPHRQPRLPNQIEGRSECAEKGCFSP